MFVGEVPQLTACYSQGKTRDELLTSIKDVIALCLEGENNEVLSEFIGIQELLRNLLKLVPLLWCEQSNVSLSLLRKKNLKRCHRLN